MGLTFRQWVLEQTVTWKCLTLKLWYPTWLQSEYCHTWPLWIKNDKSKRIYFNCMLDMCNKRFLVTIRLVLSNNRCMWNWNISRHAWLVPSTLTTPTVLPTPSCPLATLYLLSHYHTTFLSSLNTHISWYSWSYWWGLRGVQRSERIPKRPSHYNKEETVTHTHTCTGLAPSNSPWYNLIP